MRSSMGARQQWQIASARASAASAGRGASASPSRRVTMAVTCCFPARPSPVTAAFTSLGVWKATGSPARAASSATTPLAWAVPITVRTLCWLKTRSTATTSGRCRRSSARPRRRPPAGASRAARRPGCGRRRRRRSGPRGRRRPAVDHAEPAPGQPRVDAEHPHPRSPSCRANSRSTGRLPVGARPAPGRAGAHVRSTLSGSALPPRVARFARMPTGDASDQRVVAIGAGSAGGGEGGDGAVEPGGHLVPGAQPHHRRCGRSRRAPRARGRRSWRGCARPSAGCGPDR